MQYFGPPSAPLVGAASSSYAALTIFFGVLVNPYLADNFGR